MCAPCSLRFVYTHNMKWYTGAPPALVSLDLCIRRRGVGVTSRRHAGGIYVNKNVSDASERDGRFINVISSRVTNCGERAAPRQLGFGGDVAATQSLAVRDFSDPAQRDLGHVQEAHGVVLDY